MKLGYVMAARTDPALKQSIADKLRPRFEVDHYLARNEDATLIDYSALDSARSRLAIHYRERSSLHWSLAAEVSATARHYDGLLATGEDVGLPLALLSWARFRRAPVFVVTHGSYFASARFGQLMRVLRGHRRLHFLCLSESLRRTLIADFGVSPANAHNTSYGVDTEFFDPALARATTSGPLVAAAGTATRDYRTLVEAVRDLDVPVRIAADSAWFREPVNVGEQETPPNVTIQSCGDYVGLRDLYAAAAFVVVPLRPARHACGYAVIAEAMAMGKAVIATRTESDSDFLIEGETGLYVNPGNAEDLRLKIDTLLCNPALAREMGSRAQERVRRDFSLEAYCERIESVVQKHGADGIKAA